MVVHDLENGDRKYSFEKCAVINQLHVHKLAYYYYIILGIQLREMRKDVKRIAKKSTCYCIRGVRSSLFLFCG